MSRRADISKSVLSSSILNSQESSIQYRIERIPDENAPIPSHVDFGGQTVYAMELWGYVPAKKNLNRRSKSGRLYTDPEAREHITSLEIQARLSWRDHQCQPLPPLINPDIVVRFFNRTYRTDSDNQFTTLLDVLRRAGVIKNDNAVSGNGTKVILPVVKDSVESVQIHLFAARGTDEKTIQH